VGYDLHGRPALALADPLEVTALFRRCGLGVAGSAVRVSIQASILSRSNLQSDPILNAGNLCSRMRWYTVLGWHRSHFATSSTVSISGAALELMGET
jgi:hypothetical protein